MIYRAYKTELDPNNKQITLFKQNAGAARFAYNWAIVQKQEAYAKKEKYPTAIDLNKKLNSIKKTEFPWMHKSSKCSPEASIHNCDKAFDAFFKRCREKKKGKKGYPKFKTKKNGIGSFSLYGQIHIFPSQIQLPRIGKVRLKQRDYLPVNAKILGATVSEKAGKWFVSLRVEETNKENTPKEKSVIGIDLGIKTLVTTSDGEVFYSPKALKKNLKKLQRRSREVSRKEKGSNNRRKAVKKLSKLHYHIACIRKDQTHKITTHLTKSKSMIGIEDLNVSGMMKNHKLSRAIADVGMYEFRRQLEYKGNWYNCEIVTVNRFFPSSKKCSCCSKIKQDLKLSDRIYHCEYCGLTIDRDLNAAINIKNESTASSAGIYAFGDSSSGLMANCQVNLLSMKKEQNRRLVLADSS